jgi:hypothetical protein
METIGVDFTEVLQKMKGFSESIGVVKDILEDTILQLGAEHLYSEYLAPKVRPYVAKHTCELAIRQIEINDLRHDPGE